MSRVLRCADPLAGAVAEAIRSGDIEELKRLLRDNQGLATASIRHENGDDGASRTLLHVATDRPGHFPNVAVTIGVLVDAGADVDGEGAEDVVAWLIARGAKTADELTGGGEER